MSKKYIPALEFYNYGENNRMDSSKASSYKVKISDKEGNIITIENDDGLYACVKLSFDNASGILKLLDVAHDDSVLAEIEMPNADYIYNCRFDEEINAILFDVKSLYGDKTSTIELDVESLVDIYEAGQGIEIGEKNPETGKKPISIKLANGEDLLQLSDDGLSISNDVTTDDELERAVSGKADISYVDEKIASISGISGDLETIIAEIERIEDIIGTDIDDPNLDERIDSKADLDEFNDLENEVGEIEAAVNILSGDVTTLKDVVSGLNVTVEAQTGTGEEPDIYTIKQGDEIVGTITVQKGSYIEDAKIVTDVHGTPYLVLIMSDGRKINVNLSKVFDDYSNGDGINIVNHVISVKLSEDGENYLVLDENGLSTSGITEAITAETVRAQEVEGQLWTAVNGETTRAQEVESQLWSAISNEANQRETADGQLWDAVNGETSRAQEVEGQLWTAIGGLATSDQLNAEIQARTEGDASLQSALDDEIQARIEGDEQFLSKIDEAVSAERERAEIAETDLSNRLDAEERERRNADNAISGSVEDEIDRAEAAERALAGEIRDVKNSISGFSSELSAETAARIAKDEELDEAIAEIRETSVTKEYVDTKDRETYENAVNSAITESKEYTDTEIDNVENELKQYCDSGHTELQNAISDNATKINVISNLKGVSGDDASNYDDSGNGILDVLHREFHELEQEIGYITNPTIQKTNKYEVAFGEYNKSNTGESDAEKTMFSIGNGTSDSDRRNAFEIRKDGTVYMWIEGEYMAVNNLIGMLAHEIY